MNSTENTSNVAPKKLDWKLIGLIGFVVAFYLLFIFSIIRSCDFATTSWPLMIYLFIIQSAVFYVTLRHREVERPLPNFDPIKSRLNKKFSTIKDILLKEFEYAQETAAQAMDDRHTLVNYFLIITGAIFSFNFGFLKDSAPPQPYHFKIIQITALMCNFIGWIYFFKIVRLRQAWIESARAMNHIKELFLHAGGIKDKEAQLIFRWKPTTLPLANKSMTVFHYSAVLLTFFSSVTFSLSVLAAVQFRAYYLFAGLVGFYHFIFQNRIYFIALAEIKEKQRASKN